MAARRTSFRLSPRRTSFALGQPRAETFKAGGGNPDQLRIPKGNGELSGRWMDMPGTVLWALSEDLGFTSEAALSVDPQPASPEMKAMFAERFGKPIPPSWTDVEVDFGDGAERVAMGRDAAGRKQAIYTSAYDDKNEAIKWNRIGQVSGAGGQLHDGLADIKDDPAKAAARLMMLEGIRVGSSDKQRGKVMSYGAATLLADHATVSPDGKSVDLKFTAKEGIPAHYTITDPALVEYIQHRLDTAQPGEKLFETDSTQTIDKIREISGLPGMKNHDLRTLLANRIAAAEVRKYLAEHGVPKTKKAYEQARRDIGDVVAGQLRNKRNQALKSYINPAVLGPLLPEAA